MNPALTRIRLIRALGLCCVTICMYRAHEGNCTLSFKQLQERLVTERDDTAFTEHQFDHHDRPQRITQTTTVQETSRVRNDQPNALPRGPERPHRRTERDDIGN